MKKHDLVYFLDSHNIYYTEQGNNVKKGNINIACPFCGDDPSQHLGIKLDSEKWGCLRNTFHRGSNLERLFVKLIGGSKEQARRIINGNQIGLIDNFELSFEEKKEKSKKRPEKIELLEKFKDLKQECFESLRFRKYLKKRLRIDDKLLNMFIDRFKIKYCVSLGSKWNYRLIFPVYLYGDLVTWSSRLIVDQGLRYKDLSVEDSIVHVKRLLYDYDYLVKNEGRILYVVEGIFDFFNLFLRLPEGHFVTCLFTKTITSSQKVQLQRLSRNYEKIVFLLDNDALLSSVEIQRELCFLKNVFYEIIPERYKDPAVMSKESIEILGRG